MVEEKAKRAGNGVLARLGLVLIFGRNPINARSIHNSNHPPNAQCLVMSGLSSVLYPLLYPISLLQGPHASIALFVTLGVSKAKSAIAFSCSRLTMFSFYSFNYIFLLPHVTFTHKSCCSDLGSGDMREPDFFVISICLHALTSHVSVH